MSFVRCVIGSLFIAALLVSADNGMCTVEQQITERTRQYQESLRQRAEQLSPSLRTKIESQVRQTVSQGTARWKKGKVNLRVALPRWAEVQCIARFVKRHLPYSGSPAGSFGFGIGTPSAAVVVSSVQQVVKLLTIPNVHSASFRYSLVPPLRHGGNVLSYFVQVVSTIVQRQ